MAAIDKIYVNSYEKYKEFVESEYSSSIIYCPSLKSLKRRILKWKFPVGTIYVGETYKIIVKK